MYEEEYYKGKNPDLRFHVCVNCGTVVLPHVLRNLDPTWWKFRIERRIDNWKYELARRKLDREYREG